MPGTGGFRTLRWSDRRRSQGRQGGLRVISPHPTADAQIWLLIVYDKDEAADLSPSEKGALRAALERELARRTTNRKAKRQ